jgi:hypothetical protein
MVPLLQELFFVRDGVTLDEVLKLWEVRRAQESAYHRGLVQTEKASIPGRNGIVAAVSLTRIHYIHQVLL